MFSKALQFIKRLLPSIIVDFVRGRIARLKSFAEKFITELFHKLYYNSGHRTWGSTYWLGARVLKCPLDLWIYQEILYEVKPDVIIETGTLEGASAHFLACICDLLGAGRVITIDLEPKAGRPVHPRITYLTGSSTSAELIQQVNQLVNPGQRALVILDSDHSKAHVLRELELYSGFVSPDSYLIVEDTNLNNHPVRPEFGEGPYEAVEEFLARAKNFARDGSREKLFMTFNPSGYLKRLS